MYLRAAAEIHILVGLLSIWTSVNGIFFNDNLRIENGNGFLVNSILPTTYPLDRQSVDTEQLYIYNQNTATKVTARFGSLDSSQNVSYNLNDYSNADPLSLKVVSVDGGANITAHLVHTTVTNTKPNLKVLIHSDKKLITDRCIRVFAKRSESETVSESCILRADSGDGDVGDAVICLVTVPLPYDWWSSRDIDIFYDVQKLELCTTKSNYISANPQYTLPSNAHYIGKAVLMFDDKQLAREITQDVNVGLSIPGRPQRTGELFTVTVKLHRGSALEIFGVRIELGDGLILKSVKSSDPKRWALKTRRLSGGSVVNVEATLKDGSPASSKMQEVIECIFQVAKSTVMLQADINWTIMYVERPMSLADYHQQKVHTSIPISKSDQVAHLVTVLKTHELVSMKSLTKAVATIPVWLYAIDISGNILQVNGRCKCYSRRPTSLEVNKLCDMIYLSGEGSDPRIVDIVFEYGNVRESVDVRVWYPDERMSIKLTDNRLNEIKGWKIKKETNEVNPRDTNVQCNLQYQVSDIRVYTKFYTVHERRDVYMRGGKVEVFADVTPHVRHLIQTGNRDIVVFEDGLLRGVSPGKTMVKVVSSQGATLASADIRVTSSKVEIDRISANFISDMSMVVSKSSEPGILVASYSYERSLSDKLAEGFLEIWVHFTDNRVVPLSSFAQQTYKLQIENETPSILALPSDDYSSRYIAVRAVGSGRGVLKYTLHMDQACQRKVARYLAIGDVYIDSKVSKPAGLFVNDQSYVRDRGVPQGIHIRPNVARKPLQPTKPNGKTRAHKPQIGEAQPVRIGPPQRDGDGLTPLETGMFVLMGVLGVVGSVFVTNCLIYTYRQHQKKKASTGSLGGGLEGSEKVNSGWVWLNRDTLEENSINTTPDTFLSERDFQKRCSRSDSLQSTRSKHSTGTYKGSECSIRITVNPRNTLRLPDLSDSEDDDELYSASSCRQPVIGIEEPELSDFGDECEDFSLSSFRSRRKRSADGSISDDCHESFIVHNDADTELDEIPSPTASLTQEQFDNLRESVA